MDNIVETKDSKENGEREREREDLITGDLL